MSEDRIACNAGYKQKIPLRLLRPSPKNVRKHHGSVAQLAASIAADGLIQNLTVEKVNGHYEVVAGGRRLRALQQLAKEKKLADDEPIDCSVVAGDRAAGISLAENAIREAMRPTEQFNAFKAMLDAGEAEADVAARFGVTTKFLQQRMKLAKLCTSVLEALETGEITLEMAEAFTLTDDQERQEQVFVDFQPDYEDADDIRARLMRENVYATDGRVKFVGLAAYEKAGGVVVRDLFADNDRGYIADAALLDKLVTEKLEKSAKSVRAEGWGFVEVGSKINVYSYDRIRDGLDKLDKATAGAIVTLEPGVSKVQIVRGVLKPGQKLVRDEKTGTSAATPATTATKDNSKLSHAQEFRLQAERTVVLRVEVAKKPRVALAALAASLARDMSDDFSSGELVRIGRSGSMGYTEASTREIEGPAVDELQAMEEAWMHRLPGENLFAWLIEQSESVTLELLAFLAGRAIAEHNGDQDAGKDFAVTAGVDMTQFWKVTPEWLQAQPTNYVVAAVAEACGKKAAEDVMRQKGKPGAVAKAMEYLDVVEGWLPDPLRAPAPEPPKPGKKKK